MTNNIFLDSDSIPEKARCFMCGQVKFVREAEIYYQGGRKLKLAYLCYNITNSSDVYTSSIIDSSCFHQYYDNLGYKLMVSDWYEDAYYTILSIFISSPLYISSSNTPTITTTNDITATTATTTTNDTITTTRYQLKGGGSVTLETAVHVAYSLSNVVRQYLNSVDKKKVVDVLDVERNPRLWSICYKLTNLEPLVVKVCDEPLTFRWSMYKE